MYQHRKGHDEDEERDCHDLLSCQPLAQCDDQGNEHHLIEDGSAVVDRIPGTDVEVRDSFNYLEVEHQTGERVDELQQHEGRTRDHDEEGLGMFLVSTVRGLEHIYACETRKSDLTEVEQSVYEVIQPKRDIDHVHDCKTAKDIHGKASDGAEQDLHEYHVGPCGESLRKDELERDGQQEHQRTHLILELIVVRHGHSSSPDTALYPILRISLHFKPISAYFTAKIDRFS